MFPVVRDVIENMLNGAKKIISSAYCWAARRVAASAFIGVVLMGVAVSPATASSFSGLYIGPKLAGGLVEIFNDDGDGQPVFIGPKRPPSVKRVLAEVCSARGYGEDCAKALLGMTWKESNLIGSAVGDGGRAVGYYQIHYRLHGISKECARDLRCSADWTLSYMEQNGYPKYPKYAIQCHNGCNAGNGYAASALRHGDRLWKEDGADDVQKVAVKN
jgi:hypothetical protein